VADQQLDRANKAAQGRSQLGDFNATTSCIRGCCQSGRIRLDVAKAEFVLSQSLAEGMQHASTKDLASVSIT
jgi:hypothetical protein